MIKQWYSSMSRQSHIHRAILWHCVKRHVFIHVHVSCQYMITTLSHFRDHVIAKDAFYESASFVNVDFEVCFTTQWYVCKKRCWYFMMIFFLTFLLVNNKMKFKSFLIFKKFFAFYIVVNYVNPYIPNNFKLTRKYNHWRAYE